MPCAPTGADVIARYGHNMTETQTVLWFRVLDRLAGPAAQALQDRELLDTAERCHPQTLRQMRRANAKLEESSAQIMVIGRGELRCYPSGRADRVE